MGQLGGKMCVYGARTACVAEHSNNARASSQRCPYRNACARGPIHAGAGLWLAHTCIPERRKSLKGFQKQGLGEMGERIRLYSFSAKALAL